MDIDTPEPAKPPRKKHQQAPVSVIQLESDSDSSEIPPAKKRKKAKENVKDYAPTSTAVEPQRKHTSNSTSQEGED